MTGSGKISTLSSSSSEMSDAAGSSRRSCDGGSERGVGKGSDLDLLGRNFMTRKKRKSDGGIAGDQQVPAGLPRLIEATTSPTPGSPSS